MKTTLSLALAAISLLLHVQGAVASPVVWGSFDGSRINYAGGVLSTGSEHSELRDIITANSGTIGASTSTLTAGYLGGVNVFYTSLLSTSTGVLAAAEQTALQNWVAGGGTLIVTADIFPLAAYDSFLSHYGLGGWTAVSSTGVGTVTASHQVTAGVSNFSYATNGTWFSTPSDAQILGEDNTGKKFMAVMEPSTGYVAGGRILVFGDHNMFANSFIGESQNTLLATNMAQWAANSAPTPEPAALFLLAGGLTVLMVLRKRGL